MTLIITLATSSVVHQSSDYCISDWSGNVVQTANGAKQLSVTVEGWTARVAFTGVAFDGRGYETLEWIHEEGGSADGRGGPENFIAKLAQRGTEELRAIESQHRKLTVLVTVVDSCRCRLFSVSNFEAPRQSSRNTAMDTLNWFEMDLSKPVLLQVNGLPGALRRWEMRSLERMLLANSEPSAIRDRMAAANRDVARIPRFSKLVSQGCWVYSQFADGREHGRNYGDVPGIPEAISSGFAIGTYLKSNLHPAPGKQIVIRQSVSVRGGSVELPPPTGEPRQIRFSSQSTTLEGIGLCLESSFPKIIFQPRDGVVESRKNEQIRAVLGTVTLEIDPNQTGTISLERQMFSNIPTVGGGRPRAWDYVFDLHGGTGGYTLQIRQNSVALRTSHTSGLDVVGANEELVLAAPVGGLMLHATPETPKVIGDVVASFLIRDYPELHDGATQNQPGD